MKKSQEFEKSMRRASLVYAISTGTMNSLGLSSRGSDGSSSDLAGQGAGQGGQVAQVVAGAGAGDMIVTSMSSKSRGSTKTRSYQILNAKCAPPTYYTTAELNECIEQCRSLSRDLRKASKKAIVKKLSSQALTSLGKEGDGGSRHPSLSSSHGVGASSKKSRDDGVSVSMKVIRVHRAFINKRVRAAIKAIPTMSRRVAPDISSRFTSSKRQTSATLGPSVRQHSTHSAHSAHLSFSSKLKPILPPSIDPTLAQASQQTSAHPSSHSSNSNNNSENKRNNNNNKHTNNKANNNSNNILVKVYNLFTSVFRRSNRQRS